MDRLCYSSAKSCEARMFVTLHFIRPVFIQGKSFKSLNINTSRRFLFFRLLASARQRIQDSNFVLSLLSNFSFKSHLALTIITSRSFWIIDRSTLRDSAWSRVDPSQLSITMNNEKAALVLKSLDGSNVILNGQSITRWTNKWTCVNV